MADMIFFNPPVAVGGYNTRVGGALAFFYTAGTNTPRTVYADVGLSIAHPSPLVADAEGVFPPVFVDGGGAVKVDIRDPFTGVSLPGFPMDPAFVVPAEGGGARNVNFTPTPEVPATNVQDAIVMAAASAASGFTPFGLGVTGNAGLLANLDATNTASGVYRCNGDTTGTFPVGVLASGEPLVEIWRRGANDGVQTLHTLTADGVWLRRLSGGVWLPWVRFYRPAATQAQAAAGTDATTLMTPQGVRQAINAYQQSDVTASRVQNGTYSNSTNRLMTVAVGIQSSSSAASARLRVNGVAVGHFYNGQNGVAMQGTITALVPPGQSYQLEVTGGLTILSWVEGQL